MLLRTLSLLMALLLAALAPGLARASEADQAPAQVVDGYTIAVALPSDHAATGPNHIAVTIRTADGAPVSDAAVTVAVVAYATESGHGASHSEAPAPQHEAAAADSHSAMPGLSATDRADMAPATQSGGHAASASHGAAPAAGHGDDHGADGHGAEAIPTMLERGAEPGIYVGTLHLAQAGTATVTVAFTVAGVERAALFTLPVAQARLRALVLGGFALINGLAVAAAAVLKRRQPAKQRRSAPAPRPPVIPLSPVPVAAEEERP